MAVLATLVAAALGVGAALVAPAEIEPIAVDEPQHDPDGLGDEAEAVEGLDEAGPGVDGDAEAEAGEAALDGDGEGPADEPAGSRRAPARSDADRRDAEAGTVASEDEDEDDAYDEREGVGRRGNRSRPDEGEWRAFAPFPELGPVRYRDPELRRTVWLGADVSGAYVPRSVGLFERTVWSVRPSGAWALSITPWLAAGGRHSVAWYDAENIRVRVHAHQVELSARPAATTRSEGQFDDRLAIGVSTHAIRWTDVDGFAIKPGGLLDTIVHVGYGLDHLLGVRWRLGWSVQGRYAWVYQDTQRQARASLRLAFYPRPPHRLSLDAIGYYVNRDALQAGNPLPRNSVYGQFGLGYAWISRAGIGPWTQVRANTGFMSGEAPVYEIREEALNATYGELLVGMLARWP